MKFAFVDEEKATERVAALCRALQVSKSGYYAWKQRPESARAREDRRLRVLCREAHERSRRTYGSVRIHDELKKRGEHLSRKRVVRLMQQEGIRGQRRRRFTRTTDSSHQFPIALNLLNRNFKPAAPNESWAVIDLFSRFVVGWAVSAVNDRKLVLSALEMALKRRCPSPGLVHHTDQGSPYASEDYQRVLDAHGIVCSMSRRGNCYDNAAVESFFGTFKTELGEQFESAADVKTQAFDYIEIFYNQQRTHSALGLESPADYERAARMKRAA